MLAYWVHQLDPFMVRFPPGYCVEGIRWYGCAYFLGFWVAWLTLRIFTHRRMLTLSPEQQQSLLFYLLLGVLVGGRLGYVLLYDFSYYLRHPQKIIAFWQGGMSSHGGFVGVYVALLGLSKKYKLCLYSLADLVVCLVPLGIFFGRLANFVNAETVGRITDVPWAVLFPNNLFPRHPSQLYEALGEGIGLFMWTQVSVWKTRCVQTFPGKLTGTILVYYGFVRILLECFREPDASLILGVSRGQFYSIFLALAGILLVRHTHKRIPTNNVFKL
ncbi:MAG: prolipoprotein diacylglyceryl transferase [Puniceicoccales bacterium]|jgi:phosphatidylglycerol:prolipoprotein diacylglycerol transferase|nr:prolipoprotein diacylglyceryl transferase [Puniceicoccales bacterium]